MDAASAHVVFDLLGLEAEAFSRAVEQADNATSASERISYASVAYELACGAIELAGRLRDWDPTRADDLGGEWRDLAAEMAVKRHLLAESRRAELPYHEAKV